MSDMTLPALSQPGTMPLPEDDARAKARQDSDKAIQMSEEKSQRSHVEIWKALVTVLPFVLTASTFMVQMWAQYRQDQIRNSDAQDTEWRNALQYVGVADGTHAVVGSYQMESFFEKKHDKDAHDVLATLLPKVSDPATFDNLFFKNLVGVKDQSQIIKMDHAIALRLRDLYEESKHAKRTLPPGDSFSLFISHTEKYSDALKPEEYDEAYDTIWKLDSVTKGLIELWTSPHKAQSMSPAQADLSGVVFLNGDFKGVDFVGAGNLEEASFCGQPANVPASVKGRCE